MLCTASVMGLLTRNWVLWGSIAHAELVTQSLLRGCLRGHAIAGQPNSNGLHTLPLWIAARGGLQVSVVAAGLVIVTDCYVLHDSLEIIRGQASCVYSILFIRLEILWWINHRSFAYSFCCLVFVFFFFFLEWNMAQNNTVHAEVLLLF